MGLVPVPVDVRVDADALRLDAGLRVVATGQAAGVGQYLDAELRDLGVPPGPIPVSLELAWDGETGTGPAEAYELTVTAAGVTVRAGEPVGLFRGAQTLLQLAGAGSGGVPGVYIRDHPRLAYRGLMLDVARHFFGVADVKRMIDHAARYKLNHLHLHLTDDQGWRIAIDAWPRLTSHGGRTEVGDGPGGWYTKDDYREIVAYARERFITVVPEIDLPGHTNAALASYPELAGGSTVERYTGTEVGFSALRPDLEVTYTFLDQVLGELAALTPGPYLHIGGDEVETLDADAYATIVNRAQEIVAGHGKIAIGWHEIAGAKLASTSVVQFWRSTPEAPEVVTAAAQGNRVIMSPADRAYLDMSYDEASPLGLSWAGYIGVRRAYEWDPLAHLPGLDPAAVLGVEAALWTETAASVADLEYLALPRLAAIAEVAWSGRGDWESFRDRLAPHAGHWDARGVGYFHSPEVWPAGL
jgi:hexosaminidase